MTTPTNPPPNDEELVTQLRALGVIYGGWVELGPNGHYGFDDAAGLRPMSHPLYRSELAQISARLDQALADGHAELFGEPDEDGYRQLRLTDAGIGVLDDAAAEQQAARQHH